MRTLGVLAVAALVAPFALAQSPSVDAPVSFLVYHAFGGPEPDPLASERAPAPSYGDRLPAALFDRALQADRAPENQPESALAHFRHYQDLLATRERTPTPLTLHLDGELVGDTLRVRVDAGNASEVELVVFEHAVELGGRPQPYVARHREDLPRGASGAEITLDPSWDRARLGVVALVEGTEEVIQSATWMVGAPPVEQRGRAVLVEHVTASWCGPCVPADEAFALLATQRGAAGPLPSGEVQYFRAPTWQLYAGLALGALAAIALIRRRDP